MTSEEIRKRIDTLREGIENLETDMDKALQVYGLDKVEKDDKSIYSYLLTPKLDADLFDEIRDLVEAYEYHGYRLIKVSADTLSDLRRIDKAISSGLLYMDLIMSDDPMNLDELQNLAKENREQALSLENKLADLRANLFQIAWNIYFSKLDNKALLSELQQISDSFTIIEEDIGADGFITDPTEKSRNIVAEVDTPYIIGSARFMITSQYRELPIPKQREKLTEIIAPYFNEHIQALSGSRNLFRAENLLSKTIDSLMELEKADPISPPTHFYGFTDKVSKRLTDIPLGGEKYINIVSDKERKKGINVPVIVRLSGDNKDPIDNYDLEILDTVLTCWENGKAENKIKNGVVSVSLQEFYRQLKHDPYAQLESEDERRDIIYRLLKLASTIQFLDATQEYEHYKKYADLKDFNRMGNMLAVWIDRATINGIATEIIHISNFDMTPQYLYSKAKSQITSTPTKYLEAKAKGKSGKAKSKTTDKILIERYLRQRIETRKSQGYGITLESILEYMGIDLSEYKNAKSKKKRTIEKIIDTLDSYKANGYIQGWHYESRGREKYYKFVFKK